MTDQEKAIRERAHALWEHEGRPHGRHDAHWEQARREIEETRAKAATKNPTRATTKKPAAAAGAGEPKPAEKKPAARKKPAAPAPKAAKPSKPRTDKSES